MCERGQEIRWPTGKNGNTEGDDATKISGKNVQYIKTSKDQSAILKN